ncbi:MAG: hypothetical protein JO113_01705 [Candidatus Eremiobacteraeota bacterium]|nr:hypothetical protein [Candidatus Eremiobacteraeota bacterium]
MKPASWRVIVLALCAAGALLVLVAFLDQAGVGGSPAWYGVWGGFFSGSSEPYHLSFRGVDPGGPADRAGIREGDLVDVRGLPLRDRLSLMGQPQAGRPVTFQVQRGDARLQATVVPGPFSFWRRWQFVVSELAGLWLLFFAALIAWRRPYADNNLLLSTVLVCAGIGFASQTLFYGWPWAWPYVAIALAGQAMPVSIALWAALASSFARPLSTGRRIALNACYALVAISIVAGSGTPDFSLGLAPLLGTMTLWFDPTIFIGPAWTLLVDAAAAVALVCSVLAISAAHGVDRQRARWLLVPLAAFFGVYPSATLALYVLSYATILVGRQIFSVVAIVTPLVLTYAALNRRLIDIGFVLNRTAVFAIVSAIVIGAFILVEWAAGAWFANASHTTSVIIGALAALVLGLSMRYIHNYVDRFVDRAFFHQRHDDESALRRFAHESSYIRDSRTLLERALRTVQEHTTAESADILVRNGSTRYASAFANSALDVSENDPAIVALNAWNKPVDLHELAESRLPGELAFPMMSRGRLVGALVCGPKRDGERYPPDESDALLVLAHGVGSALDVLDAKAEGAPDPAIAELRESVRALTEITRSLSDTLADRLRKI